MYLIVLSTVLYSISYCLLDHLVIGIFYPSYSSAVERRATGSTEAFPNSSIILYKRSLQKHKMCVFSICLV